MMNNEATIYEETKALTPVEKVHLVEKILSDLDQPDERIFEVWREESRKRWVAYQSGQLTTRSHEEVMGKYAKP